MKIGCLRQIVLIAWPAWIAEMSTSIWAGGGVHLVDQRIEQGDSAHAGDADRRNVEKVAAAHPVVAGGRGRSLGMFNRRHIVLQRVSDPVNRTPPPAWAGRPWRLRGA
jgi:hypothetical protein